MTMSLPGGVAALALCALAWGVAPALPPEGEVGARLSRAFGDGMVLQRAMEVPVWGTAAPGSEVRVEIAGQSATATASAAGEWMVRLQPMRAGGPHEMTVTAASGAAIVVEDVLVGDVWLASGQSNMEWPLSQSDGGEEEVAGADWPSIRIMTIETRGATEPRRELPTEGWERVTPGTIGDFSAVAYHFGKDLHEHLGVPIGLIDASWGGAEMEAFTPMWALQESPTFAWTEEAFARFANGINDPGMQRLHREQIAAWERDKAGVTGGGVKDGWQLPAFDDSAWRTATLPSTLERIDGIGGMDGIVWFRRAVAVPAEWRGKDLVVELGPLDDYDETFWNGELVGATGRDVDGAWALPRRYVVPGRLTSGGEAVLAVRHEDSLGTGGFTGGPGVMRLFPEGEPAAAQSLEGEWRFAIEAFHGNKPGPPWGNERNTPTVIYNGMIHPLAPFAIRGVIWYQGESNASRPAQYAELSHAMIGAWRKAWGQGDFPFLTCTLSSYGHGGEAWPLLREAQARTLELPRTGLVVTTDVGDESDVHPRNKRPVGERLALAARAIAHGEDIPHHGPMFLAMTREGERLRLAFDTGSSALAFDGAPAGLEIAAADGEFVPAEALLADDGAIYLWNEAVPQPARARYAWADHTEANLRNDAGLPAVPFRAALDGVAP